MTDTKPIYSGRLQALMWIDSHFSSTGQPEEAAKVFAEIMGLFRPYQGGESLYLNHEAIEAFEAKYGVGMYNFLMQLFVQLYRATDDPLIEFGTSVYQGWLTPIGMHVKRLVNEDPEGFYLQDLTEAFVAEFSQ